MCGSLEQPGHLDASSLAFHSEVLCCGRQAARYGH